jgi:hypothetical protein
MKVEAGPDAVLGKNVAAAQLGLVTLAQAYGAGLSYHAVRHRLRTGRWLELRPRVYALQGAPVSWHQTVLAAVLTCGEGAVASHETAAWLAGLERLGKPEIIHVTVPRKFRRKHPDGVRLHYTRHLSAADTTRVGTVPVTAGARTLVDLAFVHEKVDVVALTDDAVCAGVVSRKTLRQAAERLANGRGNVDVLIDITRPGAEHEFWSWLERTASVVMSERGLPAAEWNATLRDGRGRIGIFDAVFHDFRVVLEFDGLRFHSTPAQRRRDAAKRRRAQLAGWIVLPFDWLDVVRHSARMLDEIQQALGAGTAPGAR